MSDFPPETVLSKPSTGLADFQSDLGNEPEELQEGRDEEPIEEPEEEEPQETQPEQAEESEAEEEEPPAQLSEKAQNRFQRLANRAKEKEKENEDLKQLVEALRSQTELSRQHVEAQRPYIEHQQRVWQQAEVRRQMIDQGFDPANRDDVRMFEIRADAERKTQKVDQLERQLQQLVHQQELRAFEDDLSARLVSKLASFDVPEDQLGSLYQLAYDAAVAKNIDTDQATDKVVEMMRPFLRAKKPTLKKRQSDKTPMEAHRAVALAGRSGGRPAKEVDVSDFDSILDGLYG